MDSLSFRLPEQLLPGDTAFDTRPVAVQRWVEELPMGHIGETAKRLYEMLREVNRLAIPLKDRFELMETISQPLLQVLDSLERHFTGQPFPLSQKSVRVAEFSTGLLQEVVIAYQAILNGEENASWFYRMTHSSMWLETVRYLFVYLNRILANYRLIHRTPPTGVWLAQHALYWLARENKRHNDKVKFDHGKQSTTIEHEYKQALLLSMVEPHLLSREQMQQVMSNMALWLELSELVESSARESDTKGFCIRRDADAPHTKLTDECCSDCDGDIKAGLLLDLNRLNLRLHGLMEEMGEDEKITLKGGSPVTRETLETLASCWHTFDTDRHQRIQGGGTVEVAIGMSGIFQLLQGQVGQSGRGISDQHLNDQLEELKLVDDAAVEAEAKKGAVLGERAKQDVWNDIFHATEIMPKSWSQEVDEHEYQFIPASQRDYAETGYCLEFDKKKMEPLLVGELLGVKPAGEEALQLCMVRWLNDDNGHLSTGLMRLADSMEPALVVVHHEERRTGLNCLLTIGSDHRPQLFLPHLPGIRTKKLYLVVDEKEIPVELHDRVVVSPLFDAFHFNAASVDADEEMSLDQMNDQLHDLTHKKKPKESEDFSDLWNTL